MGPQIERRFTGWHAAAMLVAFFGIVGAVNFTMAGFARSTFGGVVVENSYVASQEFNEWLDAAEQSRALGWQATTSRLADGRVSVMLVGAPDGTGLSGQARHPLGRLDDVALRFELQPDGSYRSLEALPDERWTLRLEASNAGHTWRSEGELR